MVSTIKSPQLTGDPAPQLWAGRGPEKLVAGKQTTEDADTAAQEQEAGSEQKQGIFHNSGGNGANLPHDRSSDLRKLRNQRTHSRNSLRATSFLKNNIILAKYKRKWVRVIDSNNGLRVKGPTCYHCTNPRYKIIDA